ncbi:MAG: diguanylate cyclase domain-containing protein [Bacteroides sp.]
MKSLHKKILTLLIASVMLTVLLVGGAGILNAGCVVEEDSSRIMNLTCDKKTQEINTWLLSIEQSVDTIYGFADSQLTDNRIFWNDEKYMDAYTEKVYAVMENLIKNTDCALSIYLRFNQELLTSVSGVFLVKNEDGSLKAEEMTDILAYDPDDREHVGWYYEPLQNGGPTWMEPYKNKNINKNMISYVIPIYRGDVTIGVLGMDVDLDALKEKVSEISAYSSGYAVLMGSNGDVIYSKNYPDGINTGEYNSKLMELKKETGEIYSYHWNGMSKRMVFGNMINGMTLAIVAPSSEIDAARNTLIVQCLIILIVVLAFATLLGIRLTRQLTKPLLELTQAAEQIAKGNWNVAIECSSKDEVGVLAQTLKEAIGELNKCISYISHLAYTDNLTGLNNRHYMKQYSCDYIENGAQDVGVVFCDLNRLKYTNDHYGHSAGDELICNFVKVLKEAFPDDMCCRMSGDEFVVVVVNKSEEEFLNMVKELNILNNREEIPLAAIGSTWKAKAESIGELLTEAEDAMYRDKKLFYEKFPEYRR